MDAPAQWLLPADHINLPDASISKVCPFSIAASSHSSSMTVRVAGGRKLPVSSHHRETPTSCPQLWLVQGTVSCGVSPLLCWLLQSHAVSRSNSGLIACPAPGH